MLDQLRNLIAQLRFRGMEAALDAEIVRAERGSVPAVDLLYRMLLEEAASKRERSLAYRLQEAHMPWNWSLESFPFERQPGVDKRQNPNPRRIGLSATLRQRSVGWSAGYRQNRYSFGSIAPSLRQRLSRPLL